MSLTATRRLSIMIIIPMSMIHRYPMWTLMLNYQRTARLLERTARCWRHRRPRVIHARRWWRRHPLSSSTTSPLPPTRPWKNPPKADHDEVSSSVTWKKSPPAEMAQWFLRRRRVHRQIRPSLRRRPMYGRLLLLQLLLPPLLLLLLRHMTPELPSANERQQRLIRPHRSR